MFKHLLASLACLTAAPCASTDQSTPFALVQFESGVDGGVRQEYMVVASDGQSLERAALFNFLSGRQPQTRRLPADRPLSINATMTHFSLGIEMAHSRCNALARFTPVAGRTYRVVQAELRLDICELRVIDTSTGAPPGDLEITDNANTWLRQSAAPANAPQGGQTRQ